MLSYIQLGMQEGLNAHAAAHAWYLSGVMTVGHWDRLFRSNLYRRVCYHIRYGTILAIRVLFSAILYHSYQGVHATKRTKRGLLVGNDQLSRNILFLLIYDNINHDDSRFNGISKILLLGRYFVCFYVVDAETGSSFFISFLTIILNVISYYYFHNNTYMVSDYP